MPGTKAASTSGHPVPSAPCLLEVTQVVRFQIPNLIAFRTHCTRTHKTLSHRCHSPLWLIRLPLPLCHPVSRS